MRTLGTRHGWETWCSACGFDKQGLKELGRLKEAGESVEEAHLDDGGEVDSKVGAPTVHTTCIRIMCCIPHVS